VAHVGFGVIVKTEQGYTFTCEVETGRAGLYNGGEEVVGIYLFHDFESTRIDWLYLSFATFLHWVQFEYYLSFEIFEDL
jgi:hypothetical protein